MTKESSDHAGLLDDPVAPRSRFTLSLPERWKFIKVTEVARLTAAAVHPCNPESPSFAYLQTVLAHIESVDQAVIEGTLRLFDPITFKAQSLALARQTVGGSQQYLVCWDDFVGFAHHLGIGLVAKLDSNKRQRTDAIAVLIDRVLDDLKEREQNAAPAAVMEDLKALKGGSTCVTDVADDGAVIWKDGVGTHKLTMSALKKRLQRSPI